MSSAMTTVVTGSAELCAAVLDVGSFRSWDAPAKSPFTADSAYRRELDAARCHAGTDEALITGEGRVDGLRLAVAISEFRFLAGSVGTIAARRLVDAVERATTERLPLLLSPASGGTRMQEGTPAFLEMIAIADRVAAHRRAGLPVIVHLRHPTTGGAFASWGSLGTVTTAEPGALIGFLGPKVYRALYGERFPKDVQTAENLHDRGIVDAVVDAEELSGFVRRILSVTSRGPIVTSPATAAPDRHSRTSPDPWTSVTTTRRRDRPGTRELLDQQVHDLVELTGTGAGETATATLLCLGCVGATPCVIVGQDRSADAAPGPADLRTARRGFRLARELGLPLITVIDTAGGELSPEAENGALAGEIARCLAELIDLPVPSVSVLAGQGSGGVALSLFAARRRIAARHAWLAPLPPEGASVIVHGTPDLAADVVRDQRVGSFDLLRIGAVDRIVDECPDAADEPTAFLARLAVAIEEEVQLHTAQS
ncbi:carboxyl transferase domain-containing protein [Pseudonocardia sp. NPDC049635]|uniref:carboxyl transferase domain-containing protein n=1 Tax=Pseudonocardia sp. NPDC049635 TaxID=3155506 RepID=UPI0033FDC22A